MEKHNPKETVTELIPEDGYSDGAMHFFRGDVTENLYGFMDNEWYLVATPETQAEAKFMFENDPEKKQFMQEILDEIENDDENDEWRMKK